MIGVLWLPSRTGLTSRFGLSLLQVVVFRFASKRCLDFEAMTVLHSLFKVCVPFCQQWCLFKAFCSVWLVTSPFATYRSLVRGMACRVAVGPIEKAVELLLLPYCGLPYLTLGRGVLGASRQGVSWFHKTNHGLKGSQDQDFRIKW